MDLTPGQNFYLLTGEELVRMGVMEIHDDREFKLVSCSRENNKYVLMPIQEYFKLKATMAWQELNEVENR